MFNGTKNARSLCAAACLAILPSVPVAAQGAGKAVSQSASVQSGLGNVTGSTSSLDDKIYNGSAIGSALKTVASLGFRASGPQVAALFGNQVADKPLMLPPDEIICVDLQTLGFRGHTAPAYISSLVYASNPSSLEVALQRFDGSVNGFGVDARLDIAAGRRRFVRALAATRSVVASLSATNSPLVNLNPNERKQLLRNSVETTANQFVGALRGPRVALYSGYRSFNAVGSVFTAGISASRALRFQGDRNVESASLTPLLSLEGVQYDPTSSEAGLLPGPLARTTAFVRVRAALIFQNRTFFLKNTDNGVQLKGKWSYQTGLEYDLWNAFDQSNMLALFARLRANSHFQVAAVAGTRSDKQDYIGLTLSFSFDADRTR